MRDLTVVGTRPEAIEITSVFKAPDEVPVFDVKLCVTALHRQMPDQEVDLFDLPTDFDLNLTNLRQDISDITSNVLLGISDVYAQTVHGETTTTLAASLSAYYAQVCAGHVEDGLRTGTKYSPWPVEMNRRIIGSITDIHFVPTKKGKGNFMREGTAPDTIYITDNTVIDALLVVITRVRHDDLLRDRLAEQFNFLDSDIRMILIAGHRREIFWPGFDNICQALAEIAQGNDVKIVYPVHHNLNVQESVHRILSGIENVFLIQPLDCLPFVCLMERSTLSVADSGGVQKRSSFAGITCTCDAQYH